MPAADVGASVWAMKWLSAHITDNRYIVAAFLTLAVINAVAIEAGYYR